MVAKEVLTAVVRLDEAVALVREELDRAPAAVGLALDVDDDARARGCRLKTGCERRGGAQGRREGERPHFFDGALCLGSCGPALGAKLRDLLRTRGVKLLSDLLYVSVARLRIFVAQRLRAVQMLLLNHPALQTMPTPLLLSVKSHSPQA